MIYALRFLDDYHCGGCEHIHKHIISAMRRQAGIWAASDQQTAVTATICALPLWTKTVNCRKLVPELKKERPNELLSPLVQSQGQP